MSGNRMAHPVLISLANIDANIRSKGSLHGFLLLALLPVPSFIHNKLRVRSLLSDRLVHRCLDLILKPLKVAAAIGVMMSDPIGNLRRCHTPLVAYIADTPEQSLMACTSPKVSPVSTAIYKEFGDGIRHPPRTAADTLRVIKVMCTESPPTDLINFLKAAKTYRLNGVFEPFWRDYFGSSPSRFLLIEVLHHFHRFFFDHDLQWCIAAMGSEELDYRFTLVRTPVGYRSFSEGVSKLKQVTGRDHRSIQRYIIGIVAGAVPPRFLTAIRSLMDFRYLAQMPSFDEGALTKLTAALQSFHDNKEAIISIGGRSHFEIPKLELLQHVVPSIRASGAVFQWSADVTEHAHVTEIKKPARAGNNQNYCSQIARHLDHADKCARFDLATRILSSHTDDGDAGEEDVDHEHEAEEEMDNTSFYPSPTRKVVNYFDIASSLRNGEFPGSPRPFRTFDSSTTAINLAVKPSFRMSINEASELFRIPDLQPAIHEYIYRCAKGEAHEISGRRQTTTRCDVPATGLQIWSKIRVQQQTFHDPGTVEPPQTLVISPPSQPNASGTYDFAIVSPTLDSDWPLDGLNGMFAARCLTQLTHSIIQGHLVVQLRLVFRVLTTDTFLAYVQRFNVTPPDATSGLHGLKRALRSNGTPIGDVIPLAHIRSPAHTIPRFGKAANPQLTSHTSYELSSEFWLNKYWNKQFYYSLCPS